MTLDNRPKTRVWLSAILLVVFAVYAPSIANEFAHDDRHYAMVPSDRGQPNELVAEWQGFGRYFSSFYGEGAVGGGREYRPITVMSFALVHAVFPPEPDVAPVATAGPQHFVNILLHLIGTWLVFLLVRRLFETPWPALIATATFGLHAVRSDAVISIVGRAEILALIFGIAAQLLYVAALRRRLSAKVGLLACTAISLFAAFGSKQSAVAWVVVLPLFAAACDRDRGLAKQAEPWVFAAAAPIIAFVTLWYPVFTGSDFAVVPVDNPLEQLDFLERAYTAVMVLGHGLFHTAVPFWLHIDYGFNTFPTVGHWYDYRFLLSFAALAAVIGGAVVCARRAPALALGGAVFAAFAFTTSNIPVLVETIYSDGMMYTPALGFSLVVAFVFQLARSRVLFGLLAIWIVANAVVIVHRCTIWQDNQTLYLHEAETQPGSQRIQMAAAREYRQEGQAVGFQGLRGQECLEKWAVHLNRALAVHADKNHPLPLNDLAYMHIGRRDAMLDQDDTAGALEQELQAERYLETALASPWLEPRHGSTLHFLMSRIFERRGEVENQRRSLELALAADAKMPQSHVRLAEFLVKEKQYRRAADVMTNAVREIPNSLSLRVRALDLTYTAGSYDSFNKILAEGERQHPDNPHILAFRGVWLSSTGRHASALHKIRGVLHRFRNAIPPQVWLAIPQSLAALGQTKQALSILDKHIEDANILPPLQQKMSALKTALSK
jgi:tetratricopeptide (TPR) repeat protein